MSVYAFDHPAVQNQGLDELEAYRSRQEMLRSQVTPDLASRLVAIHQSWPDVPPGALVAMAFAGIDPTSDAAEQVERRAAEMSTGQGFHSPGEVVSAQQLQREQDAQPEQSALGEGLRTITRGAFMGMETAFEEVQRRATAGLVAVQDPDRTYAQAMELATPSMGSMLASDEFEFSDLGEGFFPGGEVYERQQELKHNLTLQGEWMSPGRALAINVTEPGTTAFNFTSGLMDAGFRIFGDPATYALAGVGKVRMASKAFATDSAIIRGLRRTTDEAFARNWWLKSAPGQRLRQSLVDVDDPYEVWRRLGGPQGKVDRDTARLIAEAKTPQHLDEVVLPRLGPQGIAEKPMGGPLSRGLGRITDPFFVDDLGSVHGIGIRARRASDRVRMLNWMPDATIDTSNPDRAMLTLHRFLQGIKATDDEAAPIMGRAFRMGVDGPGSGVRPAGETTVARGMGAGTRRLALDEPIEQPDNWLELAKDLTELSAARAIKDSVGARQTLTGTRAAAREQHIRKSLGRAFEERQRELTNYFTQEAKRPRGNRPTLIAGEEIDFERVPHLVTEYLSRNIPLPDMKDIRRHIGGYAKLMRAADDLPRPIVEGLTDGASAFMTSLWKPMVLLRGAYIARVVGEEQLRMAASGMDSMFRHPMSYLAYQTGRKGGVGLTGDTVKDMLEFQAVAQRKGGGWLGTMPGTVGTDDWVRFRRFNSQGQAIDDRAFARAWADDMSLLVNDEVSSIVARMGVDEATDYLLSAKGKHLRRQLASARHLRRVNESPQAMRDYLKTVSMRIEEKTRGNSDLINAIATGRLDGKQIRWAGPTGGDGSSSLQRGLAARLDDVGIEEVTGRRFLTTSRNSSSDHAMLDKWNRAVDFGADIIMSQPTNKMSRFPTWQQAYVRNIESQLGFMDAATQQKVIRWAAKEANLSGTQVRRMERTARAGRGTSITDVDTADMIGRSAATRDTRKLLYELTERGQFSDASRAAMPFAEAWKEILVSWSRIVRDRPHLVRRGQMGVEGARGAGWFYTDPSSGEEMFTYPGGKFVSRALLSGMADSPVVQGALSIPGVGAAATAGLGVAGAFMDEQPAEFDLEGRATGLNLFAGTVLPGFGPAVTMPASQLLPERPELDWLRDNVLFPFGEPEVEAGAFEALLPAWADKLRTAWFKDPEADRVYANSVFDVAKALMASGDYSTESPEEIERLMSVAKERAKGLWLIRGASQFVVPTGPQARFRVQDLESDWWPYQVVSTEFHRMSQEVGEDEAVADFINTFGTDLVSLVQAKSRQILVRPTTEVGDDWLRANPELETRYNLTVGLIAPDDPTGEFHYAAYQRHFAEGTREQLTPQQMLWLSNNTLGRFAYSHGIAEIERMGLTEATARPARAALRAQLMERFPGFNSHVGVRPRPPVEEQITEFRQMTQDPEVADLPAVQGIAEYLEARDQAQLMVDTIASRSTTFRSSQETMPIRMWLRARAAEIAQRNPDFIPAWERALSRELADDDLAEPGQTGAM